MRRTARAGVCKCIVGFSMFTPNRHEFEGDVQLLCVWLRLRVCKSASVTSDGASVSSIWRELLIEVAVKEDGSTKHRKHSAINFNWSHFA